MEDVISASAQSATPEQRLPGPLNYPSVSIAGREISERVAPYLVAEISCNHSGSIIKARNLIEAARDAGADAVKLQTYTAPELTSLRHKELFDFYDKIKTPREWHRELFEYAAELGITIFSSAFSADGVQFLAKLRAPAIKIASAEINDWPLIEAAVNTNLPIIVSLGMSSGYAPVDSDIVLHCVAQYPSRIEDANLRAITTLKNEWGDLVGLSDHTPGIETAIAATALGAVMIEKHFKLDDDCIDAAYSLDPKQFKAMCIAVRSIWEGMGDGVIRPTCEPRKR